MTASLPAAASPAHRLAVAAVVLVHTGLVALSATLHTPSPDEVGHLAAGVHTWQTGRLDLYRVNPPLVRVVATAPVVAVGLETPWPELDTRPGARPEFGAGKQLIAANGPRALWLFVLARWACLPFTWVGAWVCYWWARDLGGLPAGLWALGLWCFCPNVLAHAQLITPDLAAAAVGAAAGYAFWRWLCHPGWGRAVVAGLSLGLALLTKTTWVMLFGVWPLLTLVARAAGCRDRPGWLQLGVILLAGWYVLNLGYGFIGTGRPLGEYRFVSRTLNGVAPQRVATGPEVNRFAGTPLGLLPVPVPADYLLGADTQKRDFEDGMPSYLRGRWQDRGWWYYYLYALAVKVPVGVWVLGGLTAAGVALGRLRPVRWGDELALLTPAVAVLAVVSSQDGFSHHLRYVLPAMPFAFVWAGRAAGLVPGRGRLGVAAVAAAGWAVASSLLVYPHSLSYFNELAGGPRNGPAHLLNSNIDWGQDLLLLRRWVDDHPEATGLRVAHTGDVDASLVGLSDEPPPLGPPAGGLTQWDDGATYGPLPGWYAVSVDQLWARSGQYDYFRRWEPAGRVGYSIYVYHLRPDECDAVRRTLGLPPLAPAPNPGGTPKGVR